MIHPIREFRTYEQCKKDARTTGLEGQDPFKSRPRFEKLVGDLEGAYSRRINIQHRLVYQVLVEERIVKVLRLRTHYE